MLDDEVKAVIDNFAGEYDCTIMITPDIKNLIVILDMRKNDKWAERHEIRYSEFTKATLIEALKSMYEELMKGETE